MNNKDKKQIATALLKAASILEAEVTEDQIKRVASDWKRMAKEPIEVEYSKGVFYGFGSELGVLRILHKYQPGNSHNKKARAEYSKNLRTWVFSLETNR